MVVVALGSNLSGQYLSCRALLEAALDRLGALGLCVARTSKWWRSTAWPNAADPDYLNGVALVETVLGPNAVLEALLDLETAFGRRRGAPNAPRKAPPNAPRTLDLDLIAHGRSVIASEALTLPHPRAHLRRFVMGPLAEIAPGWTHPTLGVPAAALAAIAPVGRDAAPLTNAPVTDAPMIAAATGV